MAIKIHCGDALTVLRQMADESVDCVVTSPPYFGLRDYGIDGQMGLEPTPQDFIRDMVAVFEEVRRVLRSHGTCWVNMGDSYSHGGNGSRDEGRWPKQSRNKGSSGSTHAKKKTGLKPKDLMGMPWRLAFALQDAGWYLRQDIIWSKPNPMPESVIDRCTKAHEYIFLLSKSPKYHFDAAAIEEEVSPNTHARMSQDVEKQIGSERAHAGGKTNGKMKAVTKGSGKTVKVTSEKTNAATFGVKNNARYAESVCLRVEKRNKRSVWTVGTAPFKEAHFATFPPALIEPCIMAGCPKGGLVLDPFFGAGTTGLVADRLQRGCVGIELNPDYIEIARRRIAGDSGMFARVEVVQ